ncbi:MAB_1171c family putative transporter [Nonomuraea sp. NPDC004186]
MLRAFHLAVIALAWIGVGYKLIDLRRRPNDLGRLALCAALLFLALALTVGLPPLYQRIPLFAGSPSLVRLVQHSLVVLAAFSTQLLVVHLASPPGRTAANVRVRAVVMAVFLIAMIVLFAAASPGDAAEDFVAAYATWPFVTEYLLTFLGFVAVVMADIFRLSLRFTRRATAGFLRAGLWLWAGASSAGFAFAAHKAAYALMTRFGNKPPWPEGPVSTTLAGLVLALFVAGLTAYGWGPRIGAAGLWWSRYRTYRALLPLWKAFYEVMPDIVLRLPATRRAPVDLRLYRCVIEILDGRLALRAYWDGEVARAARERAMAAGLTGPRLDAAAEAAALAAALEARERGHVTGQEPPVMPDLGPDAGMAEEIRRLVLTARAYRRITTRRAGEALPASVRA